MAREPASRRMTRSPTLSPDRRRLAWLQWDHPNMPWDGTDLWVAPVGADGGLRHAHRADVLAGGRALQRVWLEATLAGLSVQPYAAAGVLSLGFVPIELALQPPLERVSSALSKLCGAGHGLVFLRLGYARSAPRARSGRRALASFGDFA